MTSPPPPAPGWYPDPSGRGNRYWDGTSWGPAAPTAPQRRKGGGVPAWLIVIGVLFLTCGGCGVLGLIGVLSSDDSKTDNRSTTRAAPTFTTGPTVAAPAPTEEPTPGIGQEVRDGKFAFTVTSVGRSQVAGDPSNPYLQTHAKGEFVNVHLTVANIGNEPQTYFAGNQKLLVGGQEYSSDTMAAFGVGTSNEEINPGLSINTVVSFDVPPGTAPDYLEVHDSMFSGGAKIRLQG